MDEDLSQLDLAGWMSQLPLSDNRLGYVHEAEAFDPGAGWSANGVAETSLQFTEVDVSSLASFGGAARLTGDVATGAGYGPHTSPREATATMHLMHHYMVCRAGGTHEG